MSVRPPSFHSSGLLLSPTLSSAGEATLNRVSPQYVELTPPSALVLEVMASGAFETLSWWHNGADSGAGSGAGIAPFSLSNFNEVLSLDSTVMEHAGEYVAMLQGKTLLEVVFQVHPFREFKCFVHTASTLFLAGFICVSQQPSLHSTQMYTCLNNVDQCHYQLHLYFVERSAISLSLPVATSWAYP